MCRTRSGVLWNGESGLRFLRQEAPPGETGEQRVYEGRGQADFYFKEGEIHASGQRKDPSAEGAETFLNRDRRAVPGAQCQGC